MFDLLRIGKHLRLNEFEQALALAQTDAWVYGSGLGLGWKASALYDLGMYKSILALPDKTAHWRYVLPKVVSLAACGLHDRAREALLGVKWQQVPGLKRVWLADALVPFMPKEALQLLENAGTVAPVALHVAALLRNGQVERAQQLLQHVMPNGHAQVEPELYLYQTIACPDAPQQQLARLNAFLQAHAVPALALRCMDSPPGPCNVMPAQAGVSVDGPLVSVLMTTFKTGERACVAIESLLNQTYRNLEIIVVDDASGDHTPDLVQAWTRKDARVRLLKLSANGGTYLAKTMGLQLARGEFVTCHDSDDWSHPVKIERQVSPLLKDASLVATTSHWMRMQDDGMFYARSVYPLMRFNPSSPLFRRELVMQRMGGWDSVRTGADSEFNARLRLVFGKRAIKRIAQPLALGSHRAGSLMTAAETGYSDVGVSPQRLVYWEAWSQWHVDCLRQGTLPRLPQDLALFVDERLFAAPQEICIDSSQLRCAQQQLQIHQQAYP